MRAAPLLPLLLLTALGSAEADGTQPVDIADPIGLGERLALLDWLHEHQVALPDEPTLEQLRLAYLAATRPQAPDPAAAAAADHAPERERLALDLWRRHSVNARADETVEALRDRLAALDAVKERTLTPIGGLGAGGGAGDDADRRRAAPLPTAAGAPVAKDRPRAAGGAGPDPAPAARPATTAVAPASASATGVVPPIDAEHAQNWANYDRPVVVARDNVELRIYRLVGDDAAYYVWTNNRNPNGGRKLTVAIDGRRYVVVIGCGRCHQPYRLACQPAADPVAAIQDAALFWFTVAENSQLPADAIRIP